MVFCSEEKDLNELIYKQNIDHLKSFYKEFYLVLWSLGEYTTDMNRIIKITEECDYDPSVDNVKQYLAKENIHLLENI